jgi:hypothetical protein
MAGSSVAPYVIPVAGFLALAIWLSMVFWADRHPVSGGAAGTEQYPGIEEAEDRQAEIGVPRQRTAVNEAEAEDAGRVPSGRAGQTT